MLSKGLEPASISRPKGLSARAMKGDVILWISDRRQMPKTRKDFQRLAQVRANEAAWLARGGKQHGAYYLGGFAIECALKACIAKKTRKHDFPEDSKYAGRVYSHDLTELLKLAGLNMQLDKDIKTNQRLAANWGVAKEWNVNSRYETSGLTGKDWLRQYPVTLTTRQMKRLGFD